jgi:hypothetical protein
MNHTSHVNALSRVVRRRTMALAGLGALFGLGAPTPPAVAGPSPTLKMGQSNTPIMPATTTLTGAASPTLRITPDPQGRGLEARGGQGQISLSGDRSGGTGIVVHGGKVAGPKEVKGGAGTVATGGSADTGYGGLGAFLWAGNGSKKARGGVGLIAGGYHGLVAQGGRAKQSGEPGQWGGEGIRAYSGTGAQIDNFEFSAGIAAFGGNAAPGGHAGAGAIVTGYVPVKGQPRSLGALGVGGAEGHGVYAEAYGSGSPAVVGESGSTAPGARGEAMVGTGVGVFGRNVSSGPGAFFSVTDGKAVQAFAKTTAIQAETTSGSALSASTTAGRSILGRSTDWAGVAAASDKAGGAYFETGAANGVAIIATNAHATVGGGPVGLPTSRGLTLLYVAEATTAVFEDIGKARLQNGRVRVDLDPLFAETIETGEYQVFLTPRGDTRGVYVAARDARGFEIREQAGGTSAVEVNYRIVARRKGFTSERRLATIKPPTPPARPEIRLPTRPEFRSVKAAPPAMTRLRQGVPGRREGGQ